MDCEAAQVRNLFMGNNCNTENRPDGRPPARVGKKSLEQETCTGIIQFGRGRPGPRAAKKKILDQGNNLNSQGRQADGRVA
jgi:hypothetical protein